MGSKAIIHVHQTRIRGNIRLPPDDRWPPIIIVEGPARRYANNVEIAGPCRIVYSPDKPRSCGARLWIETDAEVRVIS